MKTPLAQSNRRILIIDDTPAIHDDFRKILGPESEGELTLASTEEALFGTPPVDRLTFQLDSAYQGREALELVNRALAEGRPYALVFTDMRMPPGWDGIETIEQLWKADPHLQIPLYTAYSEYPCEAIAQRLEFADHPLVLNKPFDRQETRQITSPLT